MSKLEDMMWDNGWVLKSYMNCGVEYFSWHKDGFEIRDRDITEFDDFQKWKPHFRGEPLG